MTTAVLVMAIVVTETIAMTTPVYVMKTVTVTAVIAGKMISPDDRALLVQLLSKTVTRQHVLENWPNGGTIVGWLDGSAKAPKPIAVVGNKAIKLYDPDELLTAWNAQRKPYKPWTTDETTRLIELRTRGLGWGVIGYKLDRSANSCKLKYNLWGRSNNEAA